MVIAVAADVSVMLRRGQGLAFQDKGREATQLCDMMTEMGIQEDQTEE